MTKIQSDYKALRRQGWNREAARELALIMAGFDAEYAQGEWESEHA